MKLYSIDLEPSTAAEVGGSILCHAIFYQNRRYDDFFSGAPKGFDLYLKIALSSNLTRF